jgi:hypothetical protein
MWEYLLLELTGKVSWLQWELPVFQLALQSQRLRERNVHLRVLSSGMSLTILHNFPEETALQSHLCESLKSNNSAS